LEECALLLLEDQQQWVREKGYVGSPKGKASFEEYLDFTSMKWGSSRRVNQNPINLTLRN